MRSKIGIPKHNPIYDKVFQLRVKHIDSLIQTSNKFYFSILAFFGALIITIVSTSQFIIEVFGVLVLSLIIINLIILTLLVLWVSQTALQNKIDNSYNTLFYELTFKNLKDIKPMSDKKIRRLYKGYRD